MEEKIFDGTIYEEFPKYAFNFSDKEMNRYDELNHKKELSETERNELDELHRIGNTLTI